MRGALQTWKLADGTEEVDEDTLSPPRCHVCPLLAMTSQEAPSLMHLVFIARRGLGPRGDDWAVHLRAAASRVWSGREDEANAWRCDCEGEEGDEIDDHAVMLCPYNPANRPRAIIEEGPEHGDTIALSIAVGYLAAANTEQSWIESSSLRADARVGHTSRDIPIWTEADRYDPETGRPWRAYMGGWQVTHAA